MVTNTNNSVKLSSKNINSMNFDFLSSKAIRLTALYWLVLVNVGLSYLFIHTLGRI